MRSFEAHPENYFVGVTGLVTGGRIAQPQATSSAPSPRHTRANAISFFMRILFVKGVKDVYIFIIIKRSHESQQI